MPQSMQREALITSIKAAPAEQRSSDAGLAAWQFAENLTRLLPAAEGKARRAVLAELGVRVVRIGTVYERMAYDEHGQLQNASFMDFLMPYVTEVPRGIDIDHLETPSPLNPLGVKGAGEGGTIPAPAAIVSAIEDALSPFGVRFAEMPLTPGRIVAALQAVGAYDKLSAA